MPFAVAFPLASFSDIKCGRRISPNFANDGLWLVPTPLDNALRVWEDRRPFAGRRAL